LQSESTLLYLRMRPVSASYPDLPCLLQALFEGQHTHAAPQSSAAPTILARKQTFHFSSVRPTANNNKTLPGCTLPHYRQNQRLPSANQISLSFAAASKLATFFAIVQ
jgi:hypothetical protein